MKENIKKSCDSIKKMILDAAYEIGQEKGYEMITVRCLSDKIGYSTGVIYYHFENKQEIINELFDRRKKEIYNELRKRIDNAPGFYEEIYQMFLYISELDLTTKEMYVQLFSNKDIQSSKDNILFRILYEIIIKEKKDYETKKAELTAGCLLSIFMGFNLLFAGMSHLNKEDLNKLTVRISKIISNGV